MRAHLEPITGRYLHLTIDDETHRIYFEEAGRGIPLVCLHTAGSDGRQYRHLLNDSAVTQHYRVLAFDLPRHGKSIPPEGWQRREYRLTMHAYTEFIRQFCMGLKLDRPVVMGCSIGGRIVLNLAAAHAREFRALIALQAADFQAPWFDTTWVHRPDVNGAEACAGLMSGLIAPQSPEGTSARVRASWGPRFRDTSWPLSDNYARGVWAPSRHNHPNHYPDTTLTWRVEMAGHRARPRCGAHARSTGKPCQAQGLGKGGRCRLHGGASTGPKTLEGRQRISAFQLARWARWRAQRSPVRG